MGDSGSRKQWRRIGFGISVDGETVGEGEIPVLGDENRGRDSESRRRWRRTRCRISVGTEIAQDGGLVGGVKE